MYIRRDVEGGVGVDAEGVATNTVLQRSATYILLLYTEVVLCYLLSK